MKSHTFKGPTSGFVVTYTFDDLKDTQGYVGYLPSDSSIYVVFRGSSSIQNWITNLQVTKTAYKGSCCGQSCQIHKGFSEAGLKQEILSVLILLLFSCSCFFLQWYSQCCQISSF
jgi:hypothetical protein